MAIDLDRHQDANEAPVSAEWLERYLVAIESQSRQQTALLERLVALAEAGHKREDFLNEALGVDAAPATSVEIPADLAELDFVRTPDRRFLIRENGALREPTALEAARLAQTVGGGDRLDRRRP